MSKLTKEQEQNLIDKYKDLPVIVVEVGEDEFVVRGMSVKDYERVEQITLKLTADKRKSKPTTQEDDEGLVIDPEILEDILIKDYVLFPEDVYANYKKEELLVGVPEMLVEHIDSCSANNGAVPIDIGIHRGLMTMKMINDRYYKGEISEEERDKSIQNIEDLDIIEELSKVYEPKKHEPTIEQIEEWVTKYKGNGYPVYCVTFHNVVYVFRGIKQRELKQLKADAEKIVLEQGKSENDTLRRLMLERFTMYPTDFIQRMDAEHGMPANIPNIIVSGIWEASQWKTEVKTRYINA